ncbi:MAG: 50S ribosomal protein L4 [candidate division Zixibacteria bacterium HGW-Zixibacteria-1]|nr:ribosomal protein L4 [uncultured bacterium]PKK84606.1 MAG: 50S ribosomal protein L4 [candidate division Zixibacteria bacterium HGW-Zixibacteria-1]
MEVKVYNKEGAETGTITLNDAIFGLEPNPALVHQYIVNYLDNQRQGTSSSKGRSDVAGSTAKPWRQKGTGRARAGTRKSPLWRGGGIIFGPEPRNYYSKFPRKMKLTALLSAFSDKARNESITVVEDLELADVKTKTVATILDKLGLEKKKCLILDEGVNRNLHMSVRNMDKVNYSRAPLANAYEVINADVLLVTKAGLEKIEEVFAK